MYYCNSSGREIRGNIPFSTSVSSLPSVGPDTVDLERNISPYYPPSHAIIYISIHTHICTHTHTHTHTHTYTHTHTHLDIKTDNITTAHLCKMYNKHQKKLIAFQRYGCWYLSPHLHIFFSSAHFLFLE